jgi:hypothetical protein
MKMPNKENAVVAESKLKSYLLSETHSVGKSKAKFFIEAGFGRDTLEVLEHSLMVIANPKRLPRSFHRYMASNMLSMECLRRLIDSK